MNPFLSHRLPTTLVVLGALLLAPAAVAQAQSSGDTPGAQTELEALRAELEELRTEYQTKLQMLEQRLAEIESAMVEPAEPTTTIDDLKAAALAAAAEETADADTSPPPATVGGERNLSRFNPEISATGVFAATSSDERDEFELHGAELDIQSTLDPFSRARFVIGFGHGAHSEADEHDEHGEHVEADEHSEHSESGVHVEEAYVTYSALPGGLELMVGRFKQRFGVLNRQHLHALPQTEYPLVYRTIFGHEGLAQTGLSFSWLLPKPWATANEITLELTNAENEEAFSGEDFDDFAALLKIKNYWDISPATWFEWGLSGVTGETAWGGDSRVLGSDLTWHWQPPNQAKYREFTWRTEFLLSERDDHHGMEHEAWGGYSYLEGLLKRNLYAGVRYDMSEDPLDPHQSYSGFVPYLTWWQSEFVRMRAEYSYLENDDTGESDDKFTLQLVWSAGPHKHDTY